MSIKHSEIKDIVAEVEDDDAPWKPTEDVSELTTYQLGDDSGSKEIVDSEGTQDDSGKELKVPNDADEFTRLLDEDFMQARENLLEIANDGKEAVKEMIEIAKHSDHPRAYEVAGDLMKKLAEINQSVIDLYTARAKNIKEMGAGKSQEPTGNTTIDKAVFVGSTKDLQSAVNREGDNN